MNPLKCIIPFVLILLSACGGGGGDGGGGSGGGTGNKFGQIAGTLIVSASNHLEQENNDSLATANLMVAGDTYSGNAAETDSGFPTAASVCGGVSVIHDLYKLNVTGANVRVTLTMGSDDTVKNDLDLFLLDANGIVIDSSQGTDQLIETVVPPTAPGQYYLGVQACKGASAYLLAAGTTSTTTALDRLTVPVEAEFVPGELFIKRKANLTAQAFNTRHRLEPVRDIGDDTQFVRIAKKSSGVSILGVAPSDKLGTPGHERNEALGATLEALLRLRLDPSVEFVSPNFIRRASFVPNDPFYKFQWHYPAIQLPQAWDVATTFGQGVIVAVIDTGILSGHPDLVGQTVPGYDFISSSAIAGDGDGIDADPEDPGDGTRPGESSYHGTHVAGTIAARSNDAAGVAGIAGNAKIMPLRVLGRGGGTDLDIIEAIKFAAGMGNVSPIIPTKKADIINMSLGGPGSNPAVQNIINLARNAGVIVVAAAGNENTSLPSYPAAYAGVISVAGVGFDLKRGPYSNFGTTIDLAAPGGDTSVDRNSDGFADGVLSTLKDDSTGKFSFVFYQGTSMAAAHVSGVLALMRGVNPSLSPFTIDQLIDGSHPSNLRITNDLGDVGKDILYGHGLIDANKAVLAAQALLNQAPSSDSILTTSVDSLDFAGFFNVLQLNVANGGGGTLNISSVSVDPGAPWLSVTPTTGVAPLRLDVNVNRSGLADGNYTGTITLGTDAKSGISIKTITITMQVSRLAVSGNVGEVFVLVVDPVTFAAVKQISTDASKGYKYSILDVPAGEYYIYAGTDRNNNGFICDVEDACGTYGPTVKIQTGHVLPDLNFNVNNAQNQPLSLLRLASTAPTLKRLHR